MICCCFKQGRNVYEQNNNSILSSSLPTSTSLYHKTVCRKYAVRHKSFSRALLFLQFEVRPSKKFLTAQPNTYGVRILIENNPRMILQIHHVFDDDLSQLLSI